MKDEPAFPLASSEYSDEHGFWAGLSKRELFAAMAMQSLAGKYAQGNTSQSETVAKLSVEIADALLKQLGGTK